MIVKSNGCPTLRLHVSDNHVENAEIFQMSIQKITSSARTIPRSPTELHLCKSTNKFRNCIKRNLGLIRIWSPVKYLGGRSQIMMFCPGREVCIVSWLNSISSSGLRAAFELSSPAVFKSFQRKDRQASNPVLKTADFPWNWFSIMKKRDCFEVFFILEKY